MSDTALKTTSYYTEAPDGLALSKRGSLWSIGVETVDGIVEFEMSEAAACAVREFFADAVCSECRPGSPGRAGAGARGRPDGRPQGIGVGCPEAPRGGPPMNDAPQDDLTMAAHAKDGPRESSHDLASLVSQLADVVADLAGSLQARIDREDDLR